MVTGGGVPALKGNGMFSSISLGSLLGIIKVLLGVADKIATYMERKQMMNAGRVKQQRDAFKEMKDALGKASRARRHARSELDDSGVPDDYKHFRD